jgi:hypothetical protein
MIGCTACGLISSVTSLILGAFSLILLYKIYIQYSKKWFYERQGIVFSGGCVPLLGSLLTLNRFEQTKTDKNEHPGTLMLRETFGKHQPPITACFLNYYPNLFFRDPELLNELYITKNKYFDKCPLMRDLFYPLMGDSILLSDNSETWSKKRKTLSAAFYKEKLVMMCDIVKQCMKEKVEDLKEKYARTGKDMNLN